jgi:hypothetical protein
MEAISRVVRQLFLWVARTSATAQRGAAEPSVVVECAIPPIRDAHKSGSVRLRVSGDAVNGIHRLGRDNRRRRVDVHLRQRQRRTTRAHSDQSSDQRQPHTNLFVLDHLHSFHLFEHFYMAHETFLP